MGRYWRSGMIAWALLIGGCLSDDHGNRKPFGSGLFGSSQTPVNAPPAPTETASRVDSLGRQVLAANSSLTIHPLFTAIGTAQPTVFHQGSAQLYVSDGLVKRCKTEGELAAVLCLELGKMVAEQETEGAKNRLHEDERGPLGPPASGCDVVGARTDPDLTQLAEQSKWEQSRGLGRRTSQPLPPADPHVLARGYLQKTGYNPDELTKVGSLLRAAEMNPQFEQQLGNAGNSGLGIPAKRSGMTNDPLMTHQ
jgi:hypothetical protein